jgi:hypothetical protein
MSPLQMNQSRKVAIALFIPSFSILASCLWWIATTAPTCPAVGNASVGCQFDLGIFVAILVGSSPLTIGSILTSALLLSTRWRNAVVPAVLGAIYFLVGVVVSVGAFQSSPFLGTLVLVLGVVPAGYILASIASS